jgi:uncharacterized membrane protein YkvI
MTLSLAELLLVVLDLLGDRVQCVLGALSADRPHAELAPGVLGRILERLLPVGGLVLGLLAALGTAAVATRGAAARYLPLPLLTLAGDLGPGWQLAYVPAIFAAILTTAVGDAFALATRLTPGRLWLSGPLAVILALPLANQGFAILVDHGYPLLGLLSLTVFGLAFWRILRTKGR